MTPIFQRWDYGLQTSMSTRKNQEDGFFANSFANTLFKQEVSSEDLFRKTIENAEMLRRANDARFYPDEYYWELAQIKHMPGREKENALEKMLRVSKIADEAMYTQGENRDMPNIEDLIQWKQYQDLKHERFMLQEQAMQDRDQEVLSLMNRMRKETTKTNYREHAVVERKHVVGKREPKFTTKLRTCKPVVKPAKKRTVQHKDTKPNCWHFMRGHCKRGKYCDFNHDRKNTYPDSCKVFLGGLPFQITVASLKQQLLEQGYNIVNKPKVFGGFSPQVCLASAAEAAKLITLGSIWIGGLKVDVRCYQAFTEKNHEKLQDVCRRSVFLGGLRKGTTTGMIKKQLEMLGFKVVNYPLAKEGFSPKVTMATAEQAKSLVEMVKVQINGTRVDIRPYTGVGTQDKFPQE